MPTLQQFFSTAQSTEANSQELLISLLVAGNLAEISDADDFEAVRGFIKTQGRVDSGTNKTTTGVTFWLYPTGLHGPYHETDDGSLELHGALITIAEGVLLDDAVEKTRHAVTTGRLVHKHFGV